MKIKQLSRKQSFRLRLRFRRLRSSENQIVRVGSRSERINQSQCSFSGHQSTNFSAKKKNMADVADQLLLSLLLVILLQRRRQIVCNRILGAAAFGEYANLVKELQIRDRELYFRSVLSVILCFNVVCHMHFTTTYTHLVYSLHKAYTLSSHLHT